jgi:hypothetical protein
MMIKRRSSIKRAWYGVKALKMENEVSIKHQGKLSNVKVFIENIGRPLYSLVALQTFPSLIKIRDTATNAISNARFPMAGYPDFHK